MRDLPLISHWALAGEATDACGPHHGIAHNIGWVEGPSGKAKTAALFNGRDSMITVGDAAGLQLGSQEFTFTAWIKCARPMRGAFGDVLSKFDAERRCGLNLWVAGSSASYSALGDARHVHFGIDDGYVGEWIDCGNPGNGNPLIPCLAVYRDELYACLADAAAPEEACKVFRWAGEDKWIGCGRLGDDPAIRSVMSMVVHDGHLYAGTGSWDWGAAEEARRADPPRGLARVFRYGGNAQWTDLALPAKAQRVLCLASFEGALYAGLDRGGAGRCFKLEGDRWIDCGVLEDRDNFECLMPLGGVLYGASHFAIYRYEGGQQWTCIGRRPFDIEQIHSFQVAQGKLWVGTWPQGYVLRLEEDGHWTNTGKLGLDVGQPGVARINEINALGLHNGKLYAGVLPKAQIYRYETDGHWTLLGNFASRADWDPAVCPSWMRILTLTTHRGQLFTCTGAAQARAQDLDPDRTAGRMLRCRMGAVASHEHDIGGEWTHIAAVRGGREISLYINGRLVRREAMPDRCYFDLGNAEPLRIGFGAQGSFDGAISEARLYGAALQADEIAALGARP